METEAKQDVFWAKVKRLQKGFHGLMEALDIKPDSIRPKNGEGLIVTSYSSVFWVGRSLMDPDARQLKQLTEEEFEELLRRVEAGKYEPCWARTGTLQHH